MEEKLKRNFNFPESNFCSDDKTSGLSCKQIPCLREMRDATRNCRAESSASPSSQLSPSSSSSKSVSYSSSSDPDWLWPAETEQQWSEKAKKVHHLTSFFFWRIRSEWLFECGFEVIGSECWSLPQLRSYKIHICLADQMQEVSKYFSWFKKTKLRFRSTKVVRNSRDPTDRDRFSHGRKGSSIARIFVPDSWWGRKVSEK